MTGNGATTFVYDLANQPVTLTGAGTATYAHDGNLKRVKEVRAGKTIYTIYSRVTGGLVFRDEASDGKTTDYADLSGLTASRSGVSGASVRLKKTGATITPEYTHVDHLGSAIAASNASGAMIWREHYTPFGKGTRTIGAAPGNDNNTGFTGHLEDDASGLVYMQARYYDPLIGRFLSTDPIGYQDQLNLYAYVTNDPVNKTDPTGEYARGEGFTDDQWKRFDKAQQKAADRMESRATKLGQKAQKMDTKGKSGGDAMRSKAESLRKGVTALRSDGSANTGGYVANAVSDDKKADVPGWVPKADRKQVVVNLASSVWNSSGRSAQWAIGHESLHSEDGGVFGHPVGPNGAIPYKYGDDKQREAFRALRGTPEASRSADHLMDEVY